MSGLGDINFEKFKKEVCSRCDSIYDLKRRENILTNVLDSYHEELAIADDLELKYELGAEGAREVFKKRCIYVDRCEEISEYINNVSNLEEKLSKLMYYLIQEDRKQDVLYLSADVDSLYPVLLNRIIRSDSIKKTVIQDKYDTKELQDKFKTKEEDREE